MDRSARQIWVRRISAGAACALLTGGALLGGMDKAASAAAFGGAFAILLAAAFFLHPGERLASIARMHAVPIAAFILFALWCLFTAWLSPVQAAPEWRRALFHPLWAQFGSANGAVSLAPYRTLEGLAAFLGPASAFLLGAINTTDRTDRDFLGRLFTIAAACIGVYALSLLVAGAATNHLRLLAPFGSSNVAATLFGIFALMIGALVLRASRGRLGRRGPSAAPKFLALAPQIPLTIAVFALVTACLLLTASRAGLACLAGAFVLFFALTRSGAAAAGKHAHGQSAIALAALVTGVMLLIGGDFLLSRFGTFGVDAEGRRLMIETHWNAFQARPLLGHGLNTFHELNAFYSTVENWPAIRNIGAAHNIFVQMLEETGLIGAGFFMLMLAPPLARALQIAVEDRSGAEWAAAAFAAAAFVFAHGLVDFGLQVPAIGAAFAYALGAFSSGRIDPRRRRTTPPAAPDPPGGLRFRAPEEEDAAKAA